MNQLDVNHSFVLRDIIKRIFYIIIALRNKANLGYLPRSNFNNELYNHMLVYEVMRKSHIVEELPFSIVLITIIFWVYIGVLFFQCLSSYTTTNVRKENFGLIKCETVSS